MDARSTTLMRQAWPRQLIFLLFLAVLLFATAGTLGYWQGWLFLAVFTGSTTTIGFYFARHDPALIERRMRAGPRAEQEPAQKIIISLIIAGFLLLLVLPAFDHRWHWSNAPSWVAILGDAGIVVSFIVFYLVMKENSYTASTIRVEKDQPVVSTGPYALVRHPMYAGALQLIICIPLALGSFWSLLLLLAVVPVLAWRLLDEERVLARDLPGYADYMQRVRYRLIPATW